MARTRNLKHGFFRNEELAECDPLARLLFAGMWTIADREGRLEDRPKRIKADVLPYDNCDAEPLLAQLAKGGFIIRYSVEGQGYIQVATWDKHQQCHIKETPSVIPPPPEHQLSTVQEPVNTGSETELKSLTALTLTNMLKPEGTNVPMVADAPGEGEPTPFDLFFSAFWQPYPKKVKKQIALKAAKRLPKKDWQRVILAAEHYKLSTKVLRGYIKDPEGFLKDGYWRDYVDGPIIEMEGQRNGQAITGSANGRRESRVDRDSRIIQERFGVGTGKGSGDDNH